jgi:hypothetical protein
VEIPFFTAAFNDISSGAAADGASAGSAATSPDSTAASPDRDARAPDSAASATAVTASAAAAADATAATDAATAATAATAPASAATSAVANEHRIPAFSFSFDVNDDINFCLYADYLAECSRDSFCLFDRNGSEVFRKSIDFIKPAMYKRGEYLLVCDYGGRSAFVMKGVKQIWEETFTSGIISASINKNSYLTFVLDATGYRNRVRVFAPSGKALFDWVVADDYVIGSEVAPSGKELVLNRLKTSGVSLRSALEFLDMSPEPFKTVDSSGGEVFLSAFYLDNNMLAVASENMLRLYSEQGDIVTTEKYDAVMAMCEFPRGNVTVAARRNNRTLVLEYDSQTMKEKVLYIAKQPIKNLSSDGGSLFINTGDEVVVMNGKGKTILNLELDAEALYGGASDKMGVLVVSENGADVYAY